MQHIVAFLNVAIVWPNFYLYKGKKMPLVVEEYHIRATTIVKHVGGYITRPAVIPPPSNWQFKTI